MNCCKVPSAGQFVYFSLSMLINLFPLIIRISGYQIQNNGTMATTSHHMSNIERNDDDRTSGTGE